MSNVYLGDKPTKTTPVVNADEIPLLDSQDLSSGRKKVKKVTAANLKSSIGGVQSVVAGTNITINNTDPANPIISASGGGGGGVLKYSAIISASENNPVNVQILFNSLGQSINWTYERLGFLSGTTATPIEGKAILIPSLTGVTNGAQLAGNANVIDEVVVEFEVNSFNPQQDENVEFPGAIFVFIEIY